MGRELTPRDGGFTLIELVIVVAVVGILAVTVALSTGRSGLARGAGGEERAAQALTAAVAATRDTALLSRQTLGLRPLPDGWEVVARSGEGWAPSGPAGRVPGAAWEVAGVPLLPGQASDEAPPVLFLPDGRATPFVLRLAPGGVGTVCATDGWEALRCRTE